LYLAALVLLSFSCVTHLCSTTLFDKKYSIPQNYGVRSEQWSAVNSQQSTGESNVQVCVPMRHTGLRTQGTVHKDLLPGSKKMYWPSQHTLLKRESCRSPIAFWGCILA